MFYEYFANGEVDRAKIVTDILSRKIDAKTVEQLCSNPQIKASFTRGGFPNKRPKKEWNAKYLDLLACVAVAETFNKDYLLYLNKVAGYVAAKAKLKKAFAVGLLILLLLIAGIAVFRYFANR